MIMHQMRRVALLRWAFVGTTLGVVCAAAAVAMAAVPFSVDSDDRWGIPGVFAAWSVGFTAVGFLISRAQPRNPVAWLLLGAGLSAGLMQFATVTTVVAGAGVVLPSWLESAGDVAIIAFVPAGALMMFSVLLFPDGHLPSKRWRWAAVALAAIPTLLVIVSVYGVSAGGFTEGQAAPSSVEELFLGLFVLFQFVQVVPLSAMVVRFRRSQGLVRQQMKWLLYAVGAVVSTLIVTEVFMDSYLATVPGSFIVLSIPLAIGIAILRYNLYDIDRIINRTVVYSLVVTMLTLVYVSAVFALRGLLPGQGDFSVAASTLAVAALFNPVRNRVQEFIDRRFNRSKYNSAATVERAGETFRDEVDMQALTDQLNDVVVSTLQPTTASVWIRGPESLNE